MLKRNNLIYSLLLAVSMAIGLTSCCEEPAKPSIPFSIEIIGIEDYTGYWASDESWSINANLYNDEISNEILRSNNSTWNPGFGIQDGDFKSETYAGVVLKDEWDAIVEGNGKFYALVNDPKGNNYLPNYETVKIEFKSLPYNNKVYLHKKK